jgi:hypothetical protein
MRQLVSALIQQTHMPRCRVALELLLNSPPPPPPAAAPTPGPTAAASTFTPGTKDVDVMQAGSAVQQQQQAASKAQDLVQQLLTLVLTPQDLASESLLLPLLQAITMAVSSGNTGSRDGSAVTGHAGEPCGSSGAGCSGRDRAQVATAAAAALLAACTPTSRCLDVLLRSFQVNGRACGRGSISCHVQCTACP